MYKLQERWKRTVPVLKGNKDLIVLSFALAYIVALGLINRGADEERSWGV